MSIKIVTEMSFSPSPVKKLPGSASSYCDVKASTYVAAKLVYNLPPTSPVVFTGEIDPLNAERTVSLGPVASAVSHPLAFAWKDAPVDVALDVRATFSAPGHGSAVTAGVVAFKGSGQAPGRFMVAGVVPVAVAKKVGRRRRGA